LTSGRFFVAGLCESDAAGNEQEISLQDNTDCAVLAQRFQIEHGFPVLNFQLSVHPFESVFVRADIRTRFAQTETIDEKRRMHDDVAVFDFY
jgi:hypothetical protein